MRHRSRLLLGLLVLLGSVGCDQTTKHVATHALQGAGRLSFLGDLLRLEYVHNPGAFLGMGGGLPAPVRFWALTVVTGAVLLAALAWLALNRRLPAPRYAALVLLVSGGVGNWIDRVRFDGVVVDFLNLGIGPVRTGIFNVADLAIVAGAAALALWPEPRGGNAPAADGPQGS